MSTDAISPVLQWLNAHPHLSGLATFIISASESVAIIGTIIPGSIMMTAIGTLAGAGVIPLWSTIIWAILGAIVGDGISYRIGYHFKDRLYKVWPFRNNPKWLESGKYFFHRHGKLSVFLGRFVGPIRAMVPLVAGMLHMRPLHFYIANVASAIGWAPAYMFPGILLGAASLELPPDIAVHVILMLLLVSMLIILCLWLIYKFFAMVGHKIDQLLNYFWNKLHASRYFYLITRALKHHNVNKTHGQLKLAFYILIVAIAFIALACCSASYGPTHFSVNMPFYHFFRSIRTPELDQIAIYITLLGQKEILCPAFLILCAWLFYKKYWRTAFHAFALVILTVGSIVIFKKLTHSPRPWGIINADELYSFPSGHVTLSTTLYFAFGIILIKALRFKKHWPIYILIGFIVLCISVSRLYLGAHWFTDVLASWLLSALLLMIIALSYNRVAEQKQLNPLGIFSVFLMALIICYSAFYCYKSQELKKDYTEMPWPTLTISQEDWDKQNQNFFPQRRLNRFGLNGELFNLEWIGNLNLIKSTLLKNGWKIPPERDWISILHRLSDVQSTENLPLVSAIHNDKHPLLVLVKRNAENKLVVLRLWDSNLIIQNKGNLWVGTVDLVPRTYSWIFKREKNVLELTPELLFNIKPKHYTIKQINVAKPQKHNRAIRYQTVILINEN